MHDFVEATLSRLNGARSNADIETMLGHLAETLGFRSGYLLDFPNDPQLPIRLWDSNPERAAWWRAHTGNGMHSISRSLADTLAKGGVRHVSIPPDEPRYPFAQGYDFVDTTLVPITFNDNIRGVVSFSGQHPDVADQAMSLQIVCYALLVQARSIGQQKPKPKISLTPREREVVELSATGLTSEAVASQLGMSARTVNQHIDNVALKLGTKNRVHTVAEALQLGLLQ